jgi:hypothetical protein
MTIEVPTPSTELLTQLETVTVQTDQAEAAAIAGIREKFTCYAKHNGHIKTADFHKSDGANYNIDRDAYHEPDGKRLQALLVADHFTEAHTDQNRGSKGGFRLYLTEAGEWLELKRVGRWTRWQGEPSYWYTSGESGERVGALDEGEPPAGGHVRTMTDAQVADEYDLETILEQLGKTMAEMCAKLPERYNRLKTRAELAQRTIDALKA